MTTNRLEAFSDGVLAIAITIMVLEMKVPHGESWNDLLNLAPVFFSYVLSFIYVGIYWNNHHHMFHAVNKVNGKILWANLHLLFWLSMVPFVTGWIGENSFSTIPMAVYGFVLLMAAIAYAILQKVIVESQGSVSVLKKALGTDLKGKISPVLYLAAIGLAWVSPAVSGVIYIFIALMWLIPDRRIEKTIQD